MSHRDANGRFLPPPASDGRRDSSESGRVPGSTAGHGGSTSGVEVEPPLGEGEDGVRRSQPIDVVGGEVKTVGAGGGERGLGFSRKRLQEYVLMCSQQSDGGMRDKPGK